ncbi:MAG: hypothetical protein E6Q88_01380 [Lysobacteraceae bacterium]|nr:MAG: hypothetical protein E6Q88_01380 [Xanthomonadaceae bacterium]
MPASYNPSGLPQAELAFVEAEGGYSKFAQIMGVFDETGRRVVGTDSWVKQDRWTKLYLEPGRYQFAVHCQMGTLYAAPSVTVELSAGAHYKVICRAMNNGAIYGAAEAQIKKVSP